MHEKNNRTFIYEKIKWFLLVCKNVMCVFFFFFHVYRSTEAASLPQEMLACYSRQRSAINNCINTLGVSHVHVYPSSKRTLSKEICHTPGKYKYKYTNTVILCAIVVDTATDRRNQPWRFCLLLTRLLCPPSLTLTFFLHPI